MFFCGKGDTFRRREGCCSSPEKRDISTTRRLPNFTGNRSLRTKNYTNLNRKKMTITRDLNRPGQTLQRLAQSEKRDLNSLLGLAAETIEDRPEGAERRKGGKRWEEENARTKINRRRAGERRRKTASVLVEKKNRKTSDCTGRESSKRIEEDGEGIDPPRG